jgi:hypothetical protein
MFAWFAWPAWPLAGWALWCSRRYWATPAFRLPLLYLALALAAVLVFAEQRSASALPLIAPLVLVAVPGLPGLRRGAANAFDWFAMMTFTLLAGAVWFAWNTLALGQPSRFAATLERLAPEFVFQFSLPATGLALLLTFAWIWLLINSPRSPYRGVTHFAAGVLVFWALVACLLQNWIDYGKSYRSVMTTLSQILQAAPPGCLAGRDLGSSQRALLDYFVNLQARSGAEAESTCTRLLVQSTRSRPDAPPGDPWVLRWEGSRPGDRHEVLRLYVRS